MHLSHPHQLHVVDAHGSYVPATVDQILEAARWAIEVKTPPRAPMGLPALARSYAIARLAGLDHEVFAVFFLDSRCHLIEYREMFRGTLTSTSVYPREVVKEAIRCNAAVLIFAHNHPSGEAEPSNADKALTQTLKTALALVDIRVLDHIVVGGSTCYSFAENGLC